MRVLELEAEKHFDERHQYPEALIVTNGSMSLVVDGATVAVNEGGMYVVPPGVLHSVAPGSSGRLVIVD